MKAEGMKSFTIAAIMGWLVVLGPEAVSADEPSRNSDEGSQPDVYVKHDYIKPPMGPILMSSYGLVTIAVGAGFALQAYQENKDFNKKVDGEYPLATKSLADDIKAHAITADIFMFSGLALAVGGVLWWYLDDDYTWGKSKKQKNETAFKWRPMIGPTHASVVAEF